MEENERERRDWQVPPVGVEHHTTGDAIADGRHESGEFLIHPYGGPVGGHEDDAQDDEEDQENCNFSQPGGGPQHGCVT